MSEVVAHARLWIGTPYQHQASVRGVGCDCLGLVIGVYREMTGRILAVPPYTPDWPVKRGEETLLDAAARHLEPISRAHMRPGDVLAFRLRSGLPVSHVGILASQGTFLHAYGGRSVTESPLVSYWRRRIVAAFRFPEGSP